LKKHPLAQRLMTSLLAAGFVAYRDERLREKRSKESLRHPYRREAATVSNLNF
jgi:hypothetical protein